MTLLAEGAVAAPPSSSAPSRRSRRRVLLLGSAVAFAVVAAYALVPQLVWFESSGEVGFSGGEVVSLPGYGSDGTEVVMHEHEGAVAVEATVVNDGLLPVTVVDARFSDDPRALLAAVSVAADGGSLPVTLWPGERVDLRVEGEMDNCRYYHEREAQVVNDLRLDARVLGRDTTERADLGRDVVVRSPMIVDCPDRTLRRDDDIRR